MIDELVKNIPVFTIVAVRCFALLMAMPLFSMRSVSTVAKISLAGFMAYLIFPQIDFSGYSEFVRMENVSTMGFVMLLAGEALIGIITGFYISIIFSAFSTAGQFFAFQMGFSASEVYDSLSQVENPLMGQYLNLIAMLIFLQNKWAMLLFSKGLVASFKTLNAWSLINGGDYLVHFLMRSLSHLFSDALIIALPIMGTLLLITVSTGILSKAAPQMNLLSEGFPIMMLTTFFILTALMPNMIDFFDRAFSGGFAQLEQLFLNLGGKQI